MQHALEVPITIGEMVTIGDREVFALDRIGLQPGGDGTVAVTLTLLTENFHIDWSEIHSYVKFIAPAELLAQLGKPDPEEDE